MGYTRPLTPALRDEINTDFNIHISELEKCEQNVFITMEINAINTARRLINSLPDGYPIPMN
jgi:hypothetical protein